MNTYLHTKNSFKCIVAVLSFCFLLWGAFPASAFQEELRFERLSLDQGLSQSSILCMLQDSKGFLWFGTYDGLNRYDGRQMKIYSKSKLPGSISDGNVRTLYEDSSGVLWVGTKSGGLNAYNRNKDTFISFTPDQNNPNSISGKNVTSIYEDSKGQLWIGTENGLNLFDRTSLTFKKFKNTNDPFSISHDEIRSIFEDMQGSLWIGTAKGLNLFLEKEHKFKHFFNDPADDKTLCGDTVLCFYQNKENQLWIGTKEGISILDTADNSFKTIFRSLEINDIFQDRAENLWLGTIEGLGKRDPETATAKPEKMEFTFFKHNQLDPQSLSDNKVTHVIEDRSGVLWVGTYADGLSKLPPKMQAFGIIRYQPWKKDTLPGKEVSAVLEDREGLVWIGTYRNGLSSYNPQTGELKNFSSKSPEPWSLPGDRINCIFQDSKGLIWVGTRKKGVFVIDKNKGIQTSYRRDKKNKNSLSQDNIWWINEGSKGYIWIGTSKKGLNRLDRKTGDFKLYKHSDSEPNSLAHDRVRNIFEDSKNNFWICTNAGLDLMNRSDGTFIHHKSNPDNPNSISDNRVTPVAEAADGSLWIGTDEGLNRFDPATGLFTRYTQKNGFANDGIQGLCIDSDGDIWVSTFKGISHLDPKNGKILNFGISDGLQGIEFWINSYNKGQSGKIYFGGLNGMNMFYPKKIKTNPTPPPVVITALNILNSPAKLATNITETKEITLSWKDAMFSFSFAALDYQNPHLNKYKYKLEGFNDNWLNAAEGTATFTNFNHGSYVFKVKASNSDGVWNETGTSIKINITPPFWRTLWFIASVLALILLIIFVVIHFRVKSIEKQRKKLAILVDEKTADLNTEIKEHMKTEEELENAIIKAEEANKAKSAFLASMSHEIRTPLNSIIGIADLLKGTELDEEQGEYVNIFESSGEILLSIINDILDFSKLEADHVKLEAIPIDLLQEVESILYLQAAAASSRDIELISIYKPDVPEFVIGDPTRLRQIILNILSNAVKFTSCGEVSITVSRTANTHQPDNLTITIDDTGVGIDPAQLEAIFAPFSQADSSTTRKFGGSGLGLSISKKLTELMGGSITATSVPGEGSSFEITIPLPRDRESQSFLKPDLSGINIIVAAHNYKTLNSICEMLNYFKATTTTCTNTDSLKALLLSPQGHKFNLLILDLNLENGVYMLESLREAEKTIPPVMLLQRGASFDRRLIDNKLIYAGTTKPIIRRQFLRGILDVLDIGSNEDHLSADNKVNLPQMKILLTEDNIPNRELIRHFLKSSHATLVMASNGEEGLKLALNDKFDIILMDMEMPVMDGYQFLKQFRMVEKNTHGKRTGVIALTAHASADYRKRCLDAGADEFLSKPIKQAVLTQKIFNLYNRMKKE
ncbi:hybrid sensor histidine kinase/response regulator [Maridesulfovibrio ferrireducens]|uniref:hybrid sensor histidine kinase/response regulator n=1 Tax=Maridesulfovibrio ferrireducens TaxID=246191 RepID=UPI001A20FF8C|nr:hybrid sensor histidine kinase/response regulator [Maridesulfovibrio ferrireducens]MBI9113014.1 response regulator [Maridesulfovibrio ferrireducens]